MTDKEWKSFEKFVKNKGLDIKMLNISQARKLMAEWSKEVENV